VNSKQTAWFTSPGSNGWDYNCDGTNEYEYTTAVSCTVVLCSAPGWTSTAIPGCGATADWGVCSAVPCSEVLQGSKTQGCH
jgi:hypothetical protein